MEKGIYDVYYKDDTQTRHKTMKYLSEDDYFLIFYNLKTQLDELIPKRSIVRITRRKENGKGIQDK
jgi:hypothetical protein